MVMDIRRINVGLENLKDASSKMGSSISALDNIESAIKKIAAQIDPVWIGGNRDRLEGKLTQISEYAEKLKEEIKTHQNQLEESLSVYNETEETNVSAVEQLSTEDIF